MNHFVEQGSSTSWYIFLFTEQKLRPAEVECISAEIIVQQNQAFAISLRADQAKVNILINIHAV